MKEKPFSRDFESCGLGLRYSWFKLYLVDPTSSNHFYYKAALYKVWIKTIIEGYLKEIKNEIPGRQIEKRDMICARDTHTQHFPRSQHFLQHGP